MFGVNFQCRSGHMLLESSTTGRPLAPEKSLLKPRRFLLQCFPTFNQCWQVQPNGKLHTKYQLGDYKWQTFRQWGDRYYDDNNSSFLWFMAREEFWHISFGLFWISGLKHIKAFFVGLKSLVAGCERLEWRQSRGWLCLPRPGEGCTFCSVYCCITFNLL